MISAMLSGLSLFAEHMYADNTAYEKSKKHEKP